MKLIVHGLGRMGLQIARKLSESGHEVIALNRSPEPTAKAVSYGAAAATNMRAKAVTSDRVGMPPAARRMKK